MTKANERDQCPERAHGRGADAARVGNVARDVRPQLPGMQRGFPPSLGSRDILALQRFAGNATTARLLTGDRSSRVGPVVPDGSESAPEHAVIPDETHAVPRRGEAVLDARTGAGTEPSDSSDCTRPRPPSVQRGLLGSLRSNIKTAFGKADSPEPESIEGGGGLNDLDARQRWEHANTTAGLLRGATPDYRRPKKSRREPDSYKITLATVQERKDWLKDIEEIERAGLRKARTSPMKFGAAVRAQQGDSYLASKVLDYRMRRQRDETPDAPQWNDLSRKKQVKLITKFTSGLDDVGHAWVRLSAYAQGKLQALYSYGMYPLQLFNPHDGDSAGGYAGFTTAGPGQIRHPDVEHETDKRKVYQDHDVSEKQFGSALNRAQALYNSPPPYVLIGYNCTAFAREILRAGGQRFPGRGLLPGLAFTPGKLYWSLKKEMDNNGDGGIHAEDPHAKIVRKVAKKRDERAEEAQDKATFEAIGPRGAERRTMDVVPLHTIVYSDHPATIGASEHQKEMVIDKAQTLDYLWDREWTKKWNKTTPLLVGARTYYARFWGERSMRRARATSVKRDTVEPGQPASDAQPRWREWSPLEQRLSDKDNQTATGEAAGAMNELTELTYPFGINEQGAEVEGGNFVGLFKPEKARDDKISQTAAGEWKLPPTDPNIIGRNLAALAVAKHLGADLIAPTWKAKHGPADEQVEGIIMQKLDGMTGDRAFWEAHDKDKQEDQARYRDRWTKGMMFDSGPFREPVVRQSLSNLYLLDWICGQVDRHPGNYIIEQHAGVVVGVKGIDNDLSFAPDPEDTAGWLEGRAKHDPLRRAAYRGVMPDELTEIDRGMANRIIAVASQENDFRLAITGLVADAEINAAAGRLQSLANFLRPLIESDDPRVVSRWDAT